MVPEQGISTMMFDKKLINKNKAKAINDIKNSDFYQFIYSDLKERLEPIDKTYKEVLVLGFSNYYMNYVHPDQLGSIDEKSADLIFFPFGLHWLDEVQKFLLEIKTILKQDGIFICNFPGAGSLSFLRKALFLAEESANSSHFPHISPFIKFDDVTPLMQQAGFIENIISCETIELEYDNPILFMKALKSFGESNAIYNRTNYSITKSMYQFLNNYTNRPFYDQINLISLISSPTKNSIKLKPEYFTK
jgi:NADH dehydrogenase [ubiquinone] 1 alpha subcomplex assembly factor 5